MSRTLPVRADTSEAKSSLPRHPRSVEPRECTSEWNPLLQSFAVRDLIPFAPGSRGAIPRSPTSRIDTVRQRPEDSAASNRSRAGRDGAACSAAPSASRRPERRGRGVRFFPRVRALSRPKWTVSRVLFRRAVAPAPARIIHLGDALLRRSSTHTRVPAFPPKRLHLGRATLDGTSIRACSGRGLPRRRSPGFRAWALTPRFHPCLCLHPGGLSTSRASTAIGGVVSAALSLELPRVAVNDLPALRSPDFPPVDGTRPPAILRPPPAPQS